MKEQHPLLMDLDNEEASAQFAIKLSHCLLPGAIITFSGELGSGKTTIIRAMLKSMGVHSAIKSPTFSLVESYSCHNLPVHHFDLYRIQHEDELEYIGFRDYFSDKSICCIEWPEQAGTLLPHVDIKFKLNIKGAGRELQMLAMSATGKQILTCLTGES